MKMFLAGAALLLPLLGGGCASITHGPTERIAVDTTPAGADASIVCADRVVASGVTPTSLAIPRRSEPCEVAVSKEGYESSRVPLERGFSRYYWGNIGMAAGIPVGFVMLFADSAGDERFAPAFFGVAVAGCVGLVVDRVNGSMYDHDPATVTLQLQLKEARSSSE